MFKVTRLVPEKNNLMQIELSKELLKFRAGRMIFCPGCGSVMDWKRTIEVSVRLGGELVGTQGGCADCLQEAIENEGALLEIVERCADAKGARLGDPRQVEAFDGAPLVVAGEVEILDGRKVARLAREG